MSYSWGEIRPENGFTVTCSRGFCERKLAETDTQPRLQVCYAIVVRLTQRCKSSRSGMQVLRGDLICQQELVNKTLKLRSESRNRLTNSIRTKQTEYLVTICNQSSRSNLPTSREWWIKVVQISCKLWSFSSIINRGSVRDSAAVLKWIMVAERLARLFTLSQCVAHERWKVAMRWDRIADSEKRFVPFGKLRRTAWHRLDLFMR